MTENSGSEVAVTNSGRFFSDVSEVLPEFDPVKNNIDIIQWMDKIEECGELYNWDDTAIRHYGLSKLVGVARRWRDSVPRLPSPQETNWSAWKVLLKKNFPCQKSSLGLRLEAQNYKKKPNQDMIEYFYEKLARCNEASMPDEEIIEWMVHGLDNPRYRDFLGPLSRYRESHELLSDLKAGSVHIREINAKSEHHLKKVDQKSVQCNACKQTGHFKRDCPKAKAGTCFKCGVTGHYTRDCGKSVINTEKSASGQSTSGSGKPVLVVGIHTQNTSRMPL